MRQDGELSPDRQTEEFDTGDAATTQVAPERACTYASDTTTG